MDEPIEFLASRRSKRSTAGNRMQVALAEMAVEETKEVEDDNDFVIEKDEQDVFESDFESTDEEDAGKDDVEAEEKIAQEERRERRSARSRLDKTTAAAHARNKATFNPQALASSSSKPKPRVRVEEISDGPPVASTSTGETNPLKRKRMSLRTQTVLNTSETVKRLKESEHHKALAPKKTKSEAKIYTQGELIARALDNEEGNIIEHRDYLKIEEEKRKRARVMRATVKGPALRWISRIEDVTVIVPPAPSPPPTITAQPPVALVYPGVSYNPSGFPVHTTYTPVPQHSPYAQVQPYNSTFIAFQSWPPQPPPPPTSSTPALIPGPTTLQQPSPATSVTPTSSAPDLPPATTVPTPMPPMAAPSLPQSPPEPEIRIEKVSKNYLIHKLGRKEVRKPSWKDSMEAMFGNHVKWDQVKVYNNKTRPSSRPVNTCMLTGKEGRYMDPRTGVAFADVGAYKVLTELLQHQFVWSPALGCYIGKDPLPSQEEKGGVEEVMEEEEEEEEE